MFKWLFKSRHQREAKSEAKGDGTARAEANLKAIDDYRARFAAAPLGRWNSSMEFGPFATDAWEFRADGTGKIFQHSGMGDSEMSFEWQPHAQCAIRYRITSWDEEDQDDEEPPWRVLVYDFKVIRAYVPAVVMFEVPENATLKFGMSLNYLRFEREI